MFVYDLISENSLLVCSNEVNLLTEILRSRTTDLPDYGREGKTSPDVVPLGEAAEEPLQWGNLRKSVERNQPAQLDSEVMGRTPAPLVQSTVREHQLCADANWFTYFKQRNKKTHTS